jgi:hypothetical protein
MRPCFAVSTMTPVIAPLMIGSHRGNKSMYQITTNTIDGRNRTIDLHQVKVPGVNVMATKLGQPDLYRAIEPLGVPDIGPHMGWQELCLRLAVWQEQQREAASERTCESL